MDNTQVIKSNNKRVFYFDILRCIACFLVVLVHSSSSFVKEDIGSLNFWVGNIFDSIARVGVPLFVMISGALLLNSAYEYNTKKMIKHIVRMLVFFFFWAIIYSLTFQIIIPTMNGKALNVQAICNSIINGSYHLWFIYMIIGLYLITPLLRLWVKKENKKYVEYFIILASIFSFLLPQLIDFITYYFEPLGHITVLNNLNLKYIGGYTVYFLLGWYLNNFEIKYKKTLIILGLLGYLVSIFGTYILSAHEGELVIFYDNLSTHVLISAVMIFYLVKRKYVNKEENQCRGSKFVKLISNHSLGIYAIHAAIIKIALMIQPYVGISNALLALPIIYILAFGISLGISWILKKIPLINKVV